MTSQRKPIWEILCSKSESEVTKAKSIFETIDSFNDIKHLERIIRYKVENTLLNQEGFDLLLAMTRTSEGPAGKSIPIVPKSCFFASATN